MLSAQGYFGKMKFSTHAKIFVQLVHVRFVKRYIIKTEKVTDLFKNHMEIQVLWKMQQLWWKKNLPAKFSGIRGYTPSWDRNVNVWFFGHWTRPESVLCCAVTQSVRLRFSTALDDWLSESLSLLTFDEMAHKFHTLWPNGQKDRLQFD